MDKPTKVAHSRFAATVLLLGGAGVIALSAPGVIDFLQREWTVLMVGIGLVGYTAAMFVAAFGLRGPRHVRS